MPQRAPWLGAVAGNHEEFAHLMPNAIGSRTLEQATISKSRFSGTHMVIKRLLRGPLRGPYIDGLNEVSHKKLVYRLGLIFRVAV